jgi:hypothetical protein
MPEPLQMVRCKQCAMPTATPRHGLCMVCYENSLMFKAAQLADVRAKPAVWRNRLPREIQQAED